MAVCPNCKQVIKKLMAYSEVVNTYELDENGEIDLHGNDNIEGYTSFECPECNEKLFGNEENMAYEFLFNKDELQETVAKKINQMKNKNA